MSQRNCFSPKNKIPVNLINLETEAGPLVIAERHGAISDLFWAGETQLPDGREKPTPVLKKAARQIREYLAGRRRVFNLPIILNGSDFQRTVLEAVRAIPYGQVRSYKQIAQDIGRPRAARAVGTANRNCSIAIIVPCHRVIRHDGSVAEGDGGNDRRLYLLDLERDFLNCFGPEKKRARPAEP